MDKNAIKKFAVWARRELISRVSQRAAVYEITADGYGDQNASSVHGKLMSAEEKKQRSALIGQIREKGYEQVMEEIAYTWFNRFSALRFMEVNGYLPTRIRVFTNDDNAFKPQILDEAINMEMDGLDMQRVYDLKNANDDDALFKYMIITQCNALSSILPGMFQRISDYTELLFPDNLLREGSVVEQMITMIPQEDWTDQVQIIGWLYQYYNTEPKDQVFANLKKNIKISKENIPAATQLFTPDWIVRYMVENSLGRLWLEGHPNEDLKAGWKYYLDEAEQEPEVHAQLAEIRKEYAALKPEDILAIDPCQGSGHILAYMFDVLVQIYEAYGYSAREAASSIVEHNIWGLDIDERAAQLAYFSVMMKARQYDARFFKRGIQPHVHTIIESNKLDPHCIKYFVDGRSELKSAMDTLVKELHDAKEYGSILNVTQVDFDALYARFDEIRREVEPSMYSYEALEALLPLVQVAQTMAQKYHVVVTNPPYMGAGNMNAALMKYIKANYFKGRTDLFAVFIKRCKEMTLATGAFSMITMQAWMFQSSFLELRDNLLQSTMISLLHLGAHAFEDLNGEVVQTAAFVFSKKAVENYCAICVDVTQLESSKQKEEAFLSCDKPFSFNLNKTRSLPGKQIAYWISDAVEDVFCNSKPLSKVGIARRGLQTGNAPKYIRFWFEVEDTKLTLPDAFTDKQSVYWVLENNGGPVRKWYNSIQNAVLWKKDGADIKNCSSSIIPSEDLYFKRCITWNKLTTKGLALKLQQAGIIPGDLSPFFIANNDSDFYYCFGLLNSCVAPFMMRALNPTITTPTGDVGDFPVILDYTETDRIKEIVEGCIEISRKDSIASEESWEFIRHPFIGEKSISSAYNKWVQETTARFQSLISAENELNNIFITIYGLNGELESKVDEKEVTLRRANPQFDICTFISYAVGCIMGRYSLDVDGLAYAGGVWDTSKYQTFIPDSDAIIPICDDEYFEDDIVGRFVEFVEVVYGKDMLEENLHFIADALGGKGSARELIRSYFINDFYTDHLKVYQKRPIYWLFDSGKKNGFKCLVYMHRYQPDTIARIRTDYVHEQQSRYRTAIADLESRIANAGTSERVKLTKQLKKLQEQAEEVRVYEEKIHHLADQMIRIDLDDGVKVNYAKFQDVLAKIK